MATLRPTTGSSELPLSTEHTVGRSSTCRLHLAEPEVSGHHAVIRWTGESWEIRDLGSRNGTWVGDVLLAAGTRRVLEPGQRLAFGKQEATWTVLDVAPPEPLGQRADGAWRVGDDGLLLLPDAETATACIFEEGGRWVAELDHELARLVDGQELEVDGQTWTLFLPERIAATREGGSGIVDLGRATLTLRVSQDEEHVELHLQDGQDAIELPHRSHLYLVLTLARARLEDAGQDDVSESEQGWLYQEDLVRDLRIPEQQFNVVLFRARRQLKRAGVLGADELIERRRGSGQLRLGTSRVLVESL